MEHHYAARGISKSEGSTNLKVGVSAWQWLRALWGEPAVNVYIHLVCHMQSSWLQTFNKERWILVVRGGGEGCWLGVGVE